MNGAYNPDMGQNIKTDVLGKPIDMAFLAHFQVSAANAVAASNTGVHAGIILSAGASSLSVNLNSPAIPRAARIKGNVAGIAGNVTINGTNIADEVISEIIATNGNAVVEGAKAFKTISSVTLPPRVHVPALQQETIEVTTGTDKNATLVVTVTAAGMANSPKAVNVPVVADDDTVGEVATKIRAALTADADVGAFFTVGGADAIVQLTAKSYAADDATMAIALTSADTSTVAVGASTNLTAGSPQDIVSIGWNDKLGLPYKLVHNTVLKTYLNNALEGTEPTVTTDTDEVEKNTFDLNSALNGSIVDVYLMV
jgi:hypothetical protein